MILIRPFYFILDSRNHIDLSGKYFENISTIFPNLKNVLLHEKGFRGNINQSSLVGLEHIQNIRFHGTKISTLAPGSFKQLKKLKGKKLNTIKNKNLTDLLQNTF